MSITSPGSLSIPMLISTTMFMHLDKNKDFANAIKYYSTGLNLFPLDTLLLSNRCMAFLKLRCFRRALEDANRVLITEPDNPKIIYRKVKALFGLDQFTEAIEFIQQEKNKRKPNEREAPAAAGSSFSNQSPRSMELLNLNELLHHAKSYLHQQLTGEYDMAYFLNNRKLKNHECANYVGPVEIAFMNASKGRGLRATQPIKKGQLVLASKAICVMYEGLTKLSEIESRIFYEKEILREIYALYAGPELKYIEMDDPDFDYSKIDLERIQKSFQLNNFTSGPSSGCFFDQGSRPKCNGLWFYPSFINHSCYECNCFWAVYGDVLLVRAYQDINVGDEILISYCNSIGMTFTEKEQIFKRFGFECTCRLCELDRKDEAEHPGVHTRRNELLERVKTLESSDALLPVIEQLEKLSEQQNPMYLVDPYYDLGLAYSDEENFVKAEEYMIKSYKLIAGTPLSRPVDLILIWSIIHELINAGDDHSVVKAKDWVVTLKSEAQTFFGPNSENVLRSTSAQFIAFLKQHKIDV